MRSGHALRDPRRLEDMTWRPPTRFQAMRTFPRSMTRRCNWSSRCSATTLRRRTRSIAGKAGTRRGSLRRCFRGSDQPKCSRLNIRTWLGTRQQARTAPAAKPWSPQRVHLEFVDGTHGRATIGGNDTAATRHHAGWRVGAAPGAFWGSPSSQPCAAVPFALCSNMCLTVCKSGN